MIPAVPGSNLCDLLELFVRPPYRTQHIPLQVVRSGTDAIGAFLASEPGVYVADAVTAGDLDNLARAATDGGIRVLCGSAGFARSLASVAGLRPLAAPEVWLPEALGPVLVVAGSLHPSTAQQIRDAQRRGTVVVRLSELPGHTEAISGSDSVREASRALGEGLDVILTTADTGATRAQPQFSRQLAMAASYLAGNPPIGGLILTGGETAVEVLRAMGASAMSLLGEVTAGIPWGRLRNGPHSGMPVVTKAGGFGTATAITHSIQHLRDWMVPPSTRIELAACSRPPVGRCTR